MPYTPVNFMLAQTPNSQAQSDKLVRIAGGLIEEISSSKVALPSQARNKWLRIATLSFNGTLNESTKLACQSTVESHQYLLLCLCLLFLTQLKVSQAEIVVSLGGVRR